MSQHIEIHTQQLIDPDHLYYYLEATLGSINAIKKSDEGLYFYIQDQSTRGVDFWKENYGYEIRCTSMSSQADYSIAKVLVQYFLDFQKSAVILFDNEPWKYNNVEKLRFNTLESDANIIKMMVQLNNETITLFGTQRQFHIGVNVLNKLQPEVEGWDQRLMDLFLKVQYHLPESESDQVMMIGNDEETKKEVKLVNRSTNYVLSKYDYLLFSDEETNGTIDNMVLVTNDVLNQNLPEKWELIDEYTVVAPSLTVEEYLLLKEQLKPYNQIHVFAKR
ncbi:hypothetical protein [Empedobacter sp. ULE_I140]